MSCCFCGMTQIRSFVSDAQSLNHAFISTRLAELFILGTVAEINWPPAALNLAQQWTYSQKCDPICCNLMSLYNVFSACGKVWCNLPGMCCFYVFYSHFEDSFISTLTTEGTRAFCTEGIWSSYIVSNWVLVFISRPFLCSIHDLLICIEKLRSIFISLRNCSQRRPRSAQRCL